MSNFNSTVSIDRINELLSYNPDTGVFTWKIFRNNRAKSGDIAGTPSKFGHRAIRVDHMYVLEHRAAWAIINGAWPNMDIDHINGNPADNRISNLRHVSRSANLQNQKKAHKDSKTGYLGVTASGNLWAAAIYSNGNRVKLGTFSSPKDASDAYMTAKKKMHNGHVQNESSCVTQSPTPLAMKSQPVVDTAPEEFF